MRTMAVAMLLSAGCQSDVEVEVPDAWSGAEAACGEPAPWFDGQFVLPVETLERRPSPACEAVLRADFGIPAGSDVGLSAAWSLVLWPVDPNAYDEAAFWIDEVVEGEVEHDGWASYDDGIVTIGSDEVVGYLGASVLVHEGAHGWAPGHIRCPLTGDRACDPDRAGVVGTQLAWLDELVGLADEDGHSRGGTVEPLRSFRDSLENRVVDR